MEWQSWASLGQIELMRDQLVVIFFVEI